MPRKCKRIVGCIILLIFTTYYVDSTFFSHTHIINGVTIVHSHFHNKAHAQTGTHTTSELTLMTMLSLFHSFHVPVCFAGISAFVLLLAVIRTITENSIIYQPAFHYPLRAPPSLF